MLQYYLAGWHIKPKGVKKPYVPSPCFPSSRPPRAGLHVRQIADRAVGTGTTPFSVNSSAAATTIPMARGASTSQSKVR